MTDTHYCLLCSEETTGPNSICGICLRGIEYFCNNPKLLRKAYRYLTDPPISKRRLQYEEHNTKQYESLIRRFGQKCMICGSEHDIHRDHNHETGFIRGLLCRNCNFGLAAFNDRLGTLERAAEYLQPTSTEKLCSVKDCTEQVAHPNSTYCRKHRREKNKTYRQSNPEHYGRRYKTAQKKPVPVIDPEPPSTVHQEQPLRPLVPSRKTIRRCVDCGEVRQRYVNNNYTFPPGPPWCPPNTYHRWGPPEDVPVEEL